MWKEAQKYDEKFSFFSSLSSAEEKGREEEEKGRETDRSWKNDYTNSNDKMKILSW